jgi:YHS domain-containing protein
MREGYAMRPMTTALVMASLLLIGADPAPGRRADQEALKVYGKLVGEWKGVGQPQRQNRKGAWQESAAWAWKLSNESAALEVTVAKGKFLKSARLSPGKEPGRFVLEATLADDAKRTFVGKGGERDTLVLTAEGPPSEGLRRITLTPLHDTRLLVKLEAQDPESRAYAQLGEVGYTRQGVAFAAGESYPVCIVTEGRGTIAVKYKGQTYYVCCSGCKELFDDDPAGVLAEAEARKKAKDKK